MPIPINRPFTSFYTYQLISIQLYITLKRPRLIVTTRGFGVSCTNNKQITHGHFVETSFIMYQKKPLGPIKHELQSVFDPFFAVH